MTIVPGIPNVFLEDVNIVLDDGPVIGNVCDISEVDTPVYSPWQQMSPRTSRYVP